MIDKHNVIFIPSDTHHCLTNRSRSFPNIFYTWPQLTELNQILCWYKIDCPICSATENPYHSKYKQSVAVTFTSIQNSGHDCLAYEFTFDFITFLLSIAQKQLPSMVKQTTLKMFLSIIHQQRLFHWTNGWLRLFWQTLVPE